MNPEGFAQMTSPALEDVFGVWHETLLRVRYAETDKMGIVYYGSKSAGLIIVARAVFLTATWKRAKTLSWSSLRPIAATKPLPITMTS
jgi:hypothetical protein